LRDLVFSLLNLDLVFVFNFPVSIDFVQNVVLIFSHNCGF